MNIYRSIFGYDKNLQLTKWKKYLISKLVQKEINKVITNLKVPYDCTIKIKTEIKLKNGDV